MSILQVVIFGSLFFSGGFLLGAWIGGIPVKPWEEASDTWKKSALLWEKASEAWQKSSDKWKASAVNWREIALDLNQRNKNANQFLKDKREDNDWSDL